MKGITEFATREAALKEREKAETRIKRWATAALVSVVCTIMLLVCLRFSNNMPTWLELVTFVIWFAIWAGHFLYAGAFKYLLCLMLWPLRKMRALFAMLIIGWLAAIFAFVMWFGMVLYVWVLLPIVILIYERYLLSKTISATEQYIGERI